MSQFFKAFYLYNLFSRAPRSISGSRSIIKRSNFYWRILQKTSGDVFLNGFDVSMTCLPELIVQCPVTILDVTAQENSFFAQLEKFIITVEIDLKIFS